MNTYTIKTDKAYFAASERVLNTEAAKYALSVFIVCLLATSWDS